jgi:multicomponent Na+:H+ antiporter subunit E
MTDQIQQPRSSRVPKSGARLSAFAVTFLITAVFWLVFSGKYDPFHLSLGAASCLLVAALSADLLFPRGIGENFAGTWLRFAGYVPWLLIQIFLANLHVLRLVFHPRMREVIDPHIIEFDTTLEGDIARTTFANSITLTPGTITVSVSVMGRFSVHCIDPVSGKSLPGEMQRKIASVFKEP